MHLQIQLSCRSSATLHSVNDSDSKYLNSKTEINLKIRKPSGKIVLWSSQKECLINGKIRVDSKWPKFIFFFA